MTRIALALSVLLLLPATAVAGGWTTVGLENPAPTGIKAGDTWNARLTILQHGRTPLDGEKPVLTISNGTTSTDFVAVGAGKPGAYRAKVVFPAGGTWRVSADHGWGVTHQFAPVTVASGTPAASAAGGDSDWTPMIVAGLLAVLIAAGAAVAVARAPAAPTP